MAKAKKQEETKKPEPGKGLKQWLWQGYAEMAAFGRQGHKEIAQVLQAFPGQGVNVVEEPGTLNNPTSYEVTAQRAGEGKEPTAYERWLESKGKEAGKEPEKQKQAEPEMG